MGGASVPCDVLLLSSLSSRKSPVKPWEKKTKERGHLPFGRWKSGFPKARPPQSGWLALRLLPALYLDSSLTACSGVESTAAPQKLLILDARSYTAAVANRAKGGGCECEGTGIT